MLLFSTVLATGQCDMTVDPISSSLLCSGDCTGTINLFVNYGLTPYSYVWGSGDVTPIRNNLCESNYVVTVSDASLCDTVITVNLQAPEPLVVSVTAIDSWCNDNNASINLLVQGGVNPYVFQWQNGLTGQSISELPSGEYSVNILDSRNCSKLELISVTSVPNVVLSATKQDDLCDLKGSINFSVEGGTEPYSYILNGNIVSKETYERLEEGSYVLEVEDANTCSDSAHMEVLKIVCTDPIPDQAFTPNGDGINETWKIENIDQYPNCNITVYDRWGQIVLNYSEGYTIPWSGNNKAGELPSGAYYYVIYKEGHNESLGVYTGSVSIVR
jgi:gliding motility-associated-like protein